MMLIKSSELTDKLRGAYIFLDTNVFVTGGRSKEFVTYINQLRLEARCSFVSIASVLFEFTRGANSIEVYNQNLLFYQDIVEHIHPTQPFEKNSEFSVVMSRANAGNKSYTDFLLAAALYHYRKSGSVYLLTTDVRAFPSFFEMHHLITVSEDKSGEIRNFGFIAFNENTYAKAAQSIIKGFR